MKTQLIKHLRQAAERVLEPGYNHGNYERCNCGILAQCVTGFGAGHMKHGELWNAIKPVVSLVGGGSWGYVAEFYCSETNRLFSEVIESLLDIGITAKDIANLENLSDEKIVAQVGLGPLTKDNPQHVAKYLEAWADILEDEARRSDALNSSDICSPEKSASNLRAIQAPVLHIVDVRDGKAISV
jgi:hypothetical protein